MKQQCKIKAVVLLLLLCSASLSTAQILHCNSYHVFRELTFTTGTDPDDCVLWPDSTSHVKLYYPAAWGIPLQADKQSNLEDLHRAFETSLDVYERGGFLRGRPKPIMHVAYSPSTTYLRGRSVARAPEAITGNEYPDGRCSMIMYEPRIGADEFSRRRFIAAHETFHCIQLAAFPQPYEPMSYWWQEGGAEFAANLVYPTVNAEFDYTYDYTQYHYMFDQGDGYPSAIFFQSYANQYGIPSLINLFTVMPDRKEPGAQFAELARIPGFNIAFHHFAEQFIQERIADSGGGYVGQAEAVPKANVTVSEDMALEMTTDPYQVTQYRLTLPAEKSYEFGLSLLESPSIASIKPAWNGEWTRLNAGAAWNTRETCSASQNVEFVLTAVSPSDVQRKAKLEIKVKECEQRCESDRPLPACLIGHWHVPLDVVRHPSQLRGEFYGTRTQLHAFDYHLWIRADKTYEETLMFQNQVHGPSVMKEGEAVSFTQTVNASSRGTVCVHDDEVEFIGQQTIEKSLTMAAYSGNRSNTKRLAPMELITSLEYYCGPEQSDVEPPLAYPVNINYLKAVEGSF